MYIVILAGGSGTRFWPLSRKRHPKQLMSVFGGKSMLQRTVERVLPLKPKRVLVVTNVLQAAETCRQLNQVQGVPVDVIAEPVGKNTAPAIGIAAAIIARHDPQGVMIVLPADHYIRDEEEFRDVLLQGREAALNGYLVTLGITPDRPETGYGYIEAQTEFRGNGPYPVTRFVEKPPLEKALQFLEAGNFYWNSGMFMWQACTILNALQQHMPSLSAALESIKFSADIWDLADLKPQIEAIYREIKGESIDYGVMEKADNAVVIPADFGWSDVGCWSALPEVIEPDNAGNVIVNAPENVVIGGRGNLAYVSGKIVALLGVEGLIVVDTPDALLVASMDRAQEVKKVVEELERRGLHQLL